MNIQLETNDTFDPKNTRVTINGVKYKSFKNLKLIITQDSVGELIIEHESGYIEAYKSNAS